jgi:hypothetical protein
MLIGGATHSNSYVDVTPEAVTFHFGYLFNHTESREDIGDVKARSWPWWMGIGWRSNLRGLIGLVGSYQNVVEVSLGRRSLVWGVLPMERIAISVEDPEGLMEALKPPASAKAKKATRRSTRDNGTTTKRRTKRKAE